MWRHPGFSDTYSFTMTCEEFHERMIPQRLTSPFPFSSDKENAGFVRIRGALMEHILAQGSQRFWFMEIHDTLVP
ncbi:hypothetical protein KSF_001530 [Reticulibacter mediterranei]|uniref:Uncharacterized protein n=1 Tax=Reticulibacter mediterranei TaxID=2778369 RepID=A0A8J3IG48_9CHLR|nr:hypothetical protein KSF_001530 [Reticulibacter mediterranei]